MMLYRGIEVTYETIRDWNDKFASHIAHQIRRHRPKVSSTQGYDRGDKFKYYRSLPSLPFKNIF